MWSAYQCYRTITLHTHADTCTHIHISSYPVKGGSLVDVPSEPQGHHYPQCHVAEESGAKDGRHEPVEPLLLLDGMGEAGDARVEHLGIGEHRDGEDPTHHTEIQNKVARGGLGTGARSIDDGSTLVAGVV